MATLMDGTPVKFWAAIDVAKFTKLALMEFVDGKQKQFCFRAFAEDYEQLIMSLRMGTSTTHVAFELTGDCHCSVGYQVISEGFDVVMVSSITGTGIIRSYLL
jgi:hypothetical protein